MSQKKKTLYFKAKKSGEKLTKTITFTNSTPETILDGHWEVVYDNNDYSSTKSPYSPTNHPWISFSQQKIKGKKVKEGKEDSVKCEIVIDTRNLAPSQKFARTVKLELNTEEEWYEFPIVVETAAWNGIQVPYKEFIILSLYLMAIAFIATTNVSTVLNGASKVTPQMGIEKIKQEISSLENSSYELKKNPLNDEPNIYIFIDAYASGSWLTPLSFTIFFFGVVILFLILFPVFHFANTHLNLDLDKESIQIVLFICIFILSWFLSFFILEQLKFSLFSLRSKLTSIRNSLQSLVSLLQNADKQVNKLNEIAIQDYWDKANFNMGVTASVLFLLVFCSNYYLTWFLKDKIQSLPIRIFLLIVISCFSISLGTGFVVGFDKWFTLPLFIASGSCLVTLNIRHNLKYKKYIQNHSNFIQS